MLGCRVMSREQRPTPKPHAGVSDDPSVVLDRYRIESLLGSGAFGAVYRGQSIRSHTVVAVKIEHTTSATQRPRFEREAALLARIKQRQRRRRVGLWSLARRRGGRGDGVRRRRLAREVHRAARRLDPVARGGQPRAGVARRPRRRARGRRASPRRQAAEHLDSARRGPGREDRGFWHRARQQRSAGQVDRHWANARLAGATWRPSSSRPTRSTCAATCTPRASCSSRC
jgi:hypothetical protein